MLASAIAASTTAAMGYAAIVWFEKGERLTSESLQKLTRDLTGHLLQAFRGRQKMTRANLQQVVQTALENSPIATARGPLDPAAQTVPAAAEAATERHVRL